MDAFFLAEGENVWARPQLGECSSKIDEDVEAAVDALVEDFKSKVVKTLEKSRSVERIH